MQSLADLVAIEHFLPHADRHRALATARFVVASFLLLLVGAYLAGVPERVLPLVPALLLITVALWLKLWLLEIFFRVRIAEVGFSRLFAAQIYESGEIDLVRALAESKAGKDLFLALGIDAASVDELLENRGRSQALGVRTLSGASALAFDALALELYKRDDHFALFVRGKGVDEERLVSAARKVVEDTTADFEAERWWSYKHLSHIRGAAKDWSHGNTPVLDRFSVSLADYFLSAGAGDSRSGFMLEEKLLVDRHIAIIEQFAGDGRKLLAAFAELHAKGTLHPALAASRAVLFDGNKLLAHAKNSEEAERFLIELVHECLHHGRVIFVVEDMAGFLAAARGYGVDAGVILAELFRSKEIFAVVVGASAELPQSFAQMQV